MYSAFCMALPSMVFWVSGISSKQPISFRLSSFMCDGINVWTSLILLVLFVAKTSCILKIIVDLKGKTNRIIDYIRFAFYGIINTEIYMKAFLTLLLLVLSNTFMVFAWYGHLKFAEWKWFNKLGLVAIILISWGIALFEYIFQVPANRIGFKGNGGPFSLIQLKVIQEVITLVVFAIFTLVVFKTETFRTNHVIAFVCLVLAVYFMFKK